MFDLSDDDRNRVRFLFVVGVGVLCVVGIAAILFRHPAPAGVLAAAPEVPKVAPPAVTPAVAGKSAAPKAQPAEKVVAVGEWVRVGVIRTRIAFIKTERYEPIRRETSGSGSLEDIGRQARESAMRAPDAYRVAVEIEGPTGEVNQFLTTVQK